MAEKKKSTRKKKVVSDKPAKPASKSAETSTEETAPAAAAEDPTTTDATSSAQDNQAAAITAVSTGKVEMIPIDKLDLEDTTFMFRAALRTGPLKTSIKQQGQQVPIIVRRPANARKYQVISGFRRATAMKELQLKAVSALVRDDLKDDDAAAFRASVLENSARKTYSDIDRALVVKRYQEDGHTSEEAAALLGITRRQKDNLLSLLKLEPEVQAAIDDEQQHFSATHALTLRKLRNKYPRLDFKHWVATVNAESLSVAQLVRRVNAAEKGSKSTGYGSIFNNTGTDFEKGEVRLMPLKLKLGDLSDKDKEQLRGELQRLLDTI